MRINQAPEIESIVIENGHYPVGAGEAAMTAIGPAIANAINGYPILITINERSCNC